MNWDWYLAQLINRSIDIIPWLLAGLTGLGVISFSPLGRGLIRHLRSRQSDAEVNRQILGELEELRTVLGEVSERLDFTERRLAQEQSAREALRPELPARGQAERVVTPH